MCRSGFAAWMRRRAGAGNERHTCHYRSDEGRTSSTSHCSLSPLVELLSAGPYPDRAAIPNVPAQNTPDP